MKNTILEFLQETKAAYENRQENTKYGLCKYISFTQKNEEIMLLIINEIENNCCPVFDKDGLLDGYGWFKDIPALKCCRDHPEMVEKNTVELHYATRLELIDLLIKYFSEEFQEITEEDCWDGDSSQTS